jgi:hypothetical protein
MASTPVLVLVLLPLVVLVLVLVTADQTGAFRPVVPGSA